MRTLLLPALVGLLMLGGCANDKERILERKMIVLAHHYPQMAPCNLVLAWTIDTQTMFDDAIVYPEESAVSCADFGRQEADNSLERSCFEKDLRSDTNDTCVIGVNYSDYVGDIDELVRQVLDTIPAD